MDIQESLDQILRNRENLAELFYAEFLDHYPEVRSHFEGVNLRRQAVLLTMALLVMERHYRCGYPATEMYLKYLGTRHHSRGVPVEQYPMFRGALLTALERFHGPDWDGRL